ncbi:MAG: hypothetical protein SFU86_07980 [Pirellulaceae bacterium]|nr:hypothetical protein [Pirellulaceae bacterium]
MATPLSLARWAFRFRLRTALFILLFLQIPLAYVFYAQLRIQRENRAINYLTRGSGTVRRGDFPFDPMQGREDIERKQPIHQFLGTVGIDEYFYCVTRIQAEGVVYDSSFASAIEDLPRLRTLILSNPLLGTDVRFPTRRHDSLTTLTIWPSSIPSGFIRSLSGCHRLETLSLNYCNILPSQYDEFSSLSQVRALHLIDCKPSSHSWQFLGQMTYLEHLDIPFHANISDAFSYISPSVRIVNADSCTFGDSHPQITHERMALEELSFTNTSVSLEHFLVIADRSPHLRRVGFSRITFKDNELILLKERCPTIAFSRAPY